MAFLLRALNIWGFIGAVIGSISVTNLVFMYFNFGYSVVLARIYDTYKWLAHEVFLGSFFNYFGIRVGPILSDALVLWLVCAAISFRTLNSAREYYEIAIDAGAPSDEFGQVEHAVFKLRAPYFYTLNAVFNVLFWPIAFWRYWNGHKRFDVKLPFSEIEGSISFNPDVAYFIGFNTGSKILHYRTFWLAQILMIMSVSLLLIITNAGLPK